MMMVEDKNIIIRPPIPFSRPIPGGLSLGKMIEIRGSVPYGADVFTFNFTAGEDHGDVSVDRLLHISVRLYQQSVVRNALFSNVWGKEEVDTIVPFATGSPFILLILVEENSYKIAVDGQHRWEFVHRASFNLASHLYVYGSVKVDEVRFIDKFYPTPQIGTCGPPPSFPHSEIINNPKIPYYHNFPYGLTPGTMITFSGRPFVSAYRFSINFQVGECPYPPPDIGFHLDVRLWNSTVVRNVRVNDAWEKEETIVPYFPFARGKNFDLIVKVDSDKFLVAIDGQPFIDFKHRVFPLAKLNTLLVDNDVVLSSVKFECC